MMQHKWVIDCTDQELSQGLRHITDGKRNKIVPALPADIARLIVDAHNASLAKDQ